MPTTVPIQPSTSTLDRLAVGSLDTGNNTARQVNDVNFLLGYCVQPVAALAFVSGETNQIRVAYTRSPAVNVARLDIAFHRGTATPSRTTLTLSVSSGSLAWISDSSALTDVPTPQSLLSELTTVTAYLDVTGLPSNGTTVDIIFTYSSTTGGGGTPATITLSEVPLGAVDPVGSPSTERGVDAAWPTPGNPIFDGAAGSQYGTERLLTEVDAARYVNRRQLQWSCGDGITFAPQITSTSTGAAINYSLLGFTDTPRFRTRARALYGTTVENSYKARIRYQTSGAYNLWVRVRVIIVGGATTDWDFKLAPQAGSFATTLVDSAATPLTLTLPTSGLSAGAEQEVDIELYAWNGAAGTSYLTQFYMVENE